MPDDDIEFVPPDEALTKIQEVRYSLPKLLRELQIERTSSGASCAAVIRSL